MVALPAPAKKLVTSQKNADQGKTLLGLLLTKKVKEFCALFFVQKIEEMGSFTLEQTIQFGCICVLTDSSQDHAIGSKEKQKVIQSLHQQLWKLEGGFDQIVQELKDLWKKQNIPKEKMDALAQRINLLKLLTAFPANYGLTWIQPASHTVGAFQSFSKSCLQFLHLTAPVFKQNQRFIEERVGDIRKYQLTLGTAIFRHNELKNQLGEAVLKKELAVYITISNRLRVIFGLCQMHQVRLEHMLKDPSGINFHAFQSNLTEINFHIQRVKQTIQCFIDWSSYFSPMTEKIPQVAIPFLRQVFADQMQLKSTIIASLFGCIKKHFLDPTFPEEVVSEEESKNLHALSHNLIRLAINIFKSYGKNESIEWVEKEKAGLMQDRREPIQKFIEEFVNLLINSLATYKEDVQKLRQKYQDHCPIGGTVPMPNTQFAFDCNWFAEKLGTGLQVIWEPDLAHAWKARTFLALQQSFLLLHLHFSRIDESDFQKFLHNSEQRGMQYRKEKFSEDMHVEAVNTTLENANLIQITEQLSQLQETAGLITSQLIPVLASYKESLPQNSVAAVEDPSWEQLFMDEIEARVAEPDQKESGKKVRAGGKGRKQEKPQLSRFALKPLAKIEQKPVANVVVSAVYQHAVGSGWSMGAIYQPMDLCGRAVEQVHRSKYEFLHALHSFQLVEQMLVQTQNPVSKRVLAVRFMHKGYLALEQCLNTTGAKPQHHLGQMMRAAGIPVDCLWTQFADGGSLAARYPGYQFTNTASTEDLVKNILGNTKQWITDFHASLAKILEKHDKFVTIQRVRKLVKGFPTSEKLQLSPWLEEDLKMLGSLHAKAVKFEIAQKQLLEMAEKLKTSNHYVDKEMSKRLFCLDHHLSMLNGLLTVIKEFPGPHFLLQHSEEALLHVLYLADNLGTFLALSKRQTDFRDPYHYLDSFGLETGLEGTAAASLMDISHIGKGSELPYSYFTRHNPEEQLSKTMVLLSQLFDLSMQLAWYGEAKKEADAKKCMAEFWQHLNDLFDLSHILVKTHII